MKSKRGITLVALVITIIIMIILAGVSVQLVLGENGVLTKSKTAKEKNSLSTAEEKLKLKILDYVAEDTKENKEPNLVGFKEYCKADTEIEEIILCVENGELVEITQNQTPTRAKVKLKEYPYEFILNEKLDIIRVNVEGNIEKNEEISTVIPGTNIRKAIELGTDIKIKDYFLEAKNPKILYNGNQITSTKDLPVGEWNFKYNKEENIIYVDLAENYYIEDLTGKQHNLYLKNGTIIKQDSDGNSYLQFDGIDDYGKINKLEETINWADGFVIEFEANWEEFNEWSRILDFGNGELNDNIDVGNYRSTNLLFMQVINGQSQDTHDFRASEIDKNTKCKYKVEYIKNAQNAFDINFYKEDVQIFNKSTSFTVRNIERISNYIGKSNWKENKYFKGKIYSLKVTQANGEEILYYDINKYTSNNEIKTILIVGENYTNSVEDITGNAHQVNLINGAKVSKDSENKYYLNFDGIDDYGIVSELEESINWVDGFRVEFEAQWNEFNYWSRIIDFGNGPSSDNIIIANYQNSNELACLILNGNTQETYDFRTPTLEKNKTGKYKIEYKKNEKNNFEVNFYKGDNLIFNKTTSYTVRNVKRVSNYIGLSNWNGNGYDAIFKGKIYSLKVEQIDGTPILWYDINKWLELSKK